jgi:hypothetical protein
LLGVALPFASVLFVTVGLDIDPEIVLEDAASQGQGPGADLGYPFYIGLFSNVGVLLWWTAASCCGLAASILRADGGTPFAAMAAGCALSAMLGIDDLLLLHEVALPEELGISQQLVLATYGLAMLGYLLWFREFHLSMETSLLAGALLFLGASLAADVAVDMVAMSGGEMRILGMRAPLDLSPTITEPDGAWRQALHLGQELLEDSFKLVGLALWAIYHARSARSLLRGVSLAHATRTERAFGTVSRSRP